LRVHYAKRGRMRFSSHRDFARALERALRRAAVPMAYSAGFSPHPKISYLGAVPTGVASEAEYFELGVVERVDTSRLRQALDAALPEGFDVLDVVEAAGGPLADRMAASHWQVELPGTSVEEADQAVRALLAADRVIVTRMLKDGQREIDARAALVTATVSGVSKGVADNKCAILNLVVLQVTPAVRPDDLLVALRLVAGLAPVAPPIAVRLSQGPLDALSVVGDPLAEDRAARESAS
jgi:radical SAM-linked protein